MADETIENENKEPTQEENIQSAINEALNADGSFIEDNTVNEETGELNATSNETQEGDKLTKTVVKEEDKKPEASESNIENVEEDITGQQLEVKDGALVNPTTGRVVATAGRERRFYEQRELGKVRLNETQQQLTKARFDLDNANQRATSFEDSTKALYGADPIEVKLGLDIVKGFQADPTGTLKKLLAESLSKGYTIEGITTGMDGLIAQHLEQQKVSTQQTDPEQEAAQEVETFYGRRPDAKLHDGLLAQFVNANPNIDLDDAYYALRDSFVGKGLDWSKSLEPQITRQQQQKPMPNGNGGINNVVPLKEETSSSANQSMDDIIRDSMKEQGLG